MSPIRPSTPLDQQDPTFQPAQPSSGLVFNRRDRSRVGHFSTGASGALFARLCSLKPRASGLVEAWQAGGRGAEPVGRSDVAAGRGVRDPLEGVAAAG
jgi:hypothetical protein